MTVASWCADPTLWVVPLSCWLIIFLASWHFRLDSQLLSSSFQLHFIVVLARWFLSTWLRLDCELVSSSLQVEFYSSLRVDSMLQGLGSSSSGSLPCTMMDLALRYFTRRQVIDFEDQSAKTSKANHKNFKAQDHRLRGPVWADSQCKSQEFQSTNPKYAAIDHAEIAVFPMISKHFVILRLLTFEMSCWHIFCYSYSQTAMSVIVEFGCCHRMAARAITWNVKSESVCIAWVLTSILRLAM